MVLRCGCKRNGQNLAKFHVVRLQVAVAAQWSRSVFNDLGKRKVVDRKADDVAALEEPGYHGARHAFQAYGARLHPVVVDDDGIKPEALPAKGARLLYVTPSHQFPTGAVLSLARRLELLQWAQATDTWVIEDDYDSEFRYG